MKGILKVFGLLALVSLAACPDSSDDSSSPPASQFDVSAASLLSNGTASATMVSDWQIATNTDSTQVIVNTALEVWLDSNSANYDTYFNADGSIKNDSSGAAYVPFWGSYKESAATTDLSDGVTAATAGKVWIAASQTNQPSRMAITFGNAADTFMDSEGVVVVLRVFPSTTSSPNLATTGEIAEWKLTVTKDTATRTTATEATASLTVGATYAHAAAPSGGAASTLTNITSNAGTVITPVAVTGNAVSLEAANLTDTHVVALKNIVAAGNSKFTDGTVFFSHIAGAASSSNQATTNVGGVLTAVATATTKIAFSNTVRADFTAATVATTTALFTLTISDKYGSIQDVAVTVTTAA